MIIIDTVDLTSGQKQAIFRLWNNEYPSQLQYAEISNLDTYLNNLKDQRHYFLTDDDGDIYGWAFTFVRDYEKWFAIIIDSSVQGKGYGKMMLDKIKQNETLLSGWVTDHNRYKKRDGSIYYTPLNFYLKNGFNTVQGLRLELEHLSALKIEYKK